MSKSALIVDDSASARLVLTRMLESYDLVVDSCESAEDALEYLDSRRPDVIFMDHLMPGMDGFEAVRVIKKNPDTAMIPIMMYTSQEGEVYVGQARALGAVGVLPKTVKPVEVSKILASLHLVEDGPAAPEIDRGATPAADELPAEPQSEADIRTLLQDLFAQQRVILQRDLRETYSDLAAQLDKELRQRNGSGPPDEAAAEPARTPLQPRFRLPALLAATVLLATFALWQRAGMIQLEERVQALAAAAERGAAADPRRGSVAQSAGSSGTGTLLEASRAATLEALEWGVNLSAQYAFDEVPLGERRLQVFDELLERLLAAGFVGVVAVDVHVGDFCMMGDGSGSYRLAPPQLDADYCDQIGFDAVESVGLGSRQSIAFANFVLMAEEQSGGTVRFDIASRGSGDPLLAYPSSTAAVAAGDWNAIAALNNRVEVSLRPDADRGVAAR